MSNKNIKQNYFRHIFKVLNVVEKMGGKAKHFRCIVLMGDQQEQKAYSFFHAPKEDLKNLILHGFRNSKEFVEATADAFMQYDKELQEKEKSQTQNNNNNEENPIRED